MDLSDIAIADTAIAAGDHAFGVLMIRSEVRVIELDSVALFICLCK